MSIDLLVLPSPLLGPAAYEPFASALGDRGVGVCLAELPGDAMTPQAVLTAFVEQVCDSGASTLVAHSNAGYFVPAVRGRLPVAAAVFVDAALPLGTGTSTLLAPPQLGTFLAGLPKQDGLLPPWPRWWDPAEVAALFPSETWLARVSDGAPRLPPAYFTTPVEVPTHWEAQPAAYLGFGGTYAEELTFARAAGWPVTVVDGHHLHLLAEPGATADAVLALRERLDV
ncbi:MAG: hypothetical protein ABJA33_13850 [Pedococcus sp.]